MSPEKTLKFLQEYPDNLAGFSYEQVVQTCNEYFPQIPVLITDFDNKRGFSNQFHLGGRNAIYRGRPIENEGNVPFDNVSDFSFIAAENLDKIKSYGRANKPNEAMFYGSLSIPTACMETLTHGENFRASGSAMLTMGTWLFEKSMTFVQMPYSAKQLALFYETVKYQSKRFTPEGIQNSNDRLRKLLRTDIEFEILSFFGDAFAKFDIKSEADYYLTNYYADRIFNRIPGFDINHVDGIMYPSVPHSYEDFNIVMPPETVTNGLSFFEAMQIWVVTHLDGSGKTEFVPIEQRVRANKDGKLNWK